MGKRLGWLQAEGEFCGPEHPLGRQGSGLCLNGHVLWLFGGRLEGSARVYADDLWQRPCGQGELWVLVSPKQGRVDPEWPPARHNHCFVSVGGNRLVLHGGARHGALNKATKVRTLLAWLSFC
jgi:hypothetical protein